MLKNFKVDYVANLTTGGSVLGSTQVIAISSDAAANSAEALLYAADNVVSHGIVATHDLGAFDAAVLA